MKTEYYYDVSDVSTRLGVSVSKAYKIIRLLNDELRAMGYLTVAGRVSRKYFEQRIYGSNAA